MEGTRGSGVAFTGGSFRHGPFELVDDTHRCVFFMPGGKTFDLLEKMAREVADKGSHVVVITDQRLTLSGRNCCVLNVPAQGEDLFCLTAATTQELLLEAVARRRGIVAGQFRYGQKITSWE
jgi:glucosamine--fructose-6-phosphate aminotransferase (isomerizing)